ncbi:MAG TPA: tetratricopeptide repeat protein, partial [Verrucomicrobiae bacterium]|nr:tetratricopeptide repeat protein [Verrucomicrobiae bacterium]
MSNPRPEVRPKQPGRTQRFIIPAVAVLSAVLFFLGFVLWQRRAPSLPVVQTTELEPAVAELIKSSLQNVASAPRSAEAWGTLACVLMHYEFVEQANMAFTRAAQFAPREARWPYLHALLLLNRDRPEATRYLRLSTTLSADVIAPRFQLAQLLMEQGRATEAEREFQRILQQSPSHARSWLGLARLRWAAGRLDECGQYLARCLSDPQTARSANALLAQVQQKRGDRTAAAESARRSASLPEDAPLPDSYWEGALRLRVGRKARLQEASALIDQQRFREAIAALAVIAHDYPSDDDVLYLTGWTLNRLGRFEEAETALREQLRRTPDSAKALSQLGVSLLSQTKFDGAVGVLQAGLRIK